MVRQKLRVAHVKAKILIQPIIKEKLEMDANIRERLCSVFGSTWFHIWWNISRMWRGTKLEKNKN